MKNLKEAFKIFIKKQQFHPNFFGVFFNPFYFARKGLYDNIRIFGKNINGKALDVGCGSKPYQSLFNADSYIGLDYDKDGSNNNPDADYFYDSTTFPFENETYDSCICSEVLEHVFNPNEFLSEINRVLKPGGILLLTVPFVWDEHEQPFDYGRYSSFGICSVLKENRFEVIEIKKTCNDISLIFQLINCFIYKLLFLKSRKVIFNIILTMLFFTPFNLLGLILRIILPKNNDLYLDNIILAKKL